MVGLKASFGCGPTWVLLITVKPFLRGPSTRIGAGKSRRCSDCLITMARPHGSTPSTSRSRASFRSCKTWVSPAITSPMLPSLTHLKAISLQKLHRRSFDDLESEIGGFAFEIVNLEFAVLSVVKLRSSVDECHAIAQHAINQSSQLGSHSLNGNGSPELGSQSAKLRAKVGIA